jgi:Sigma-70, region 4
MTKRNGKLTKIAKRERAPSYRINMLLGENFSTALLAEFGFSHKTIARKLGLSEGQVNYRLRKAKVKVKDYRQAKNVIGSMVLHGAAQYGVDQLRLFADGHLRHQLEQLGWTSSPIKPEHPTDGNAPDQHTDG